MTDNSKADNMFVVTLTKAECKLVNWMRKSLANDDDRPVLNAMFINGELVCCDGSRLITAPTPEGLKTHTGKLLTYKGNFRPDVPTVVTAIEDKYPDYKQVMPMDKPFASFCVNPKFMIDALVGYAPDMPVTVNLHRGTLMVIGKTDTDNDTVQVKSLIMPMRDLDGVIERGVATYAVWPAQPIPDKAEQV